MLVIRPLVGGSISLRNAYDTIINNTNTARLLSSAVTTTTRDHRPRTCARQLLSEFYATPTTTARPKAFTVSSAKNAATTYSEYSTQQHLGTRQ